MAKKLYGKKDEPSPWELTLSGHFETLCISNARAEHDELENMNIGLLLLASMGVFLICFGFHALW